jgi:Ser/Thr protein kinase RdoA (MazF antagonist)
VRGGRHIDQLHDHAVNEAGVALARMNLVSRPVLNKRPEAR